MEAVDLLHRSASMMDKEIRRTRAFHRVGCTAEAAALIHDEAVLCESAIAPELVQLAAKVLVICHDVHHAGTHRYAR